MRGKPVLTVLLVLATLLAPATTWSRAHDEPSLAGESVISLPASTEPELRLGVTTADSSARVIDAIPSPQGLCTDKYEPNDSFLQALAMPSGTIWSYICAANDDDYYNFPVGTGNAISVTLDRLVADYDLCLYSPQQTLIKCSSNRGKQAESIQHVSSTGDKHYIQVYGYQGAYNTERPYRLTLEVNAPDLTITDIWEDNGEICYQIWNSGGASAVQGTVTSLSIDIQHQADDTLPGIAPGQRLERCFSNYTWSCSPLSDSIKMSADAQDSVGESDEANNSRSEVWQCDTTPPTITSGPFPAQVLQTSVVIQWMTDEDADSTVRYDLHAGKYASAQTNATLTQNHMVTLKGLTPSTVYHYVVESTDVSGNTVTSAEGFFETAPPADSEPPSVASLTVTRIPGDRELYWVSMPASDTVGVDRVEFYMNGTLIGIDYTPDVGGSAAAGMSPAVANSGQYGVKLDPPAMGLSRNMFFSAPQAFMAEAFDRAGMSTQKSLMYAPPFEPVDINLSVWPAHDRTHYVDTPADTVPAGTTINVSVHAAEEEWSCTWVTIGGSGPWGSGGPLHCRDVETAVERVEFRVNGVTVHTWYPADGSDLDHTYAWNAGGLGVGTHTLRVTAYDHDGASRSTTRRLYVEVGEPSIDITRSVTREGNHFRVQLTLENFGTASAGVDNIRDNVTGFQPVMTSTSSYEVVPEYWTETRHCDVEIEISSGGGDILWLAPGESLVVEYLAVPILYEDSDTFDYGIGARDEIKVWDQGGFCRWRPDRPAPSTTGGELLAEAVNAAREAADYIIVTHPRNLYSFDASRSDVNALLATMAELAQIKTGILGYVDVWHAEDIRAQVIAWGGGMKGSDGVDDHYLSSGYLLLVGEAEVLGSWDPDCLVITFEIML